ncbi:DUF2938 domain-containing protein [Azonexus sp. IMCC34839]|uniref:DUF2938 domain-containing protein n=1 Tax=Azonexus sp. IMCC34839 TaxID=3133695 RepID=UPI003999584D
MTATQEILRVALIGGGATLVMDIWLMFLKRVGVQTLNFAFIGRWVGHLIHGRIAHASIAKAMPIANETPLGWLTHYAIGFVFAGLLLAVAGTQWAHSPTLLPALLIGISTVVFPLFVMQPAMGLGFAASKTASPLKSCLRSVINHGVFGLGLFLSAWLIEWISR